MQRIINLLLMDNIRVLMGNLLASFFGLLNFMLMVRIMSKSDFGQIVIFMSAAGLVDLIRTGFVRQGLVRHWVTDQSGNKKGLIGAAWIIHLTIALIIIMLCLLSSFLLPISIDSMGLFLSYYPLLLLATIPHQMNSWIAQAKKSYLVMNVFRVTVNMLLFLALLINYKYELTAEQLLIYLILSHAAISLISIVWYNPFNAIVQPSRKCVWSLIKFGKYSLSTLAGSNLLKSTDTLIIGLMLTTESAAVYAIPFKFIELLEIPLRGFVMTSFSELTLQYNQKKEYAFSQHFKQRVALLTLAVIPVAAVVIFFPSFVVLLLSGEGFEESTYVLQVLSLAMLFLPLDKYLGIALDSIDRPDQNAKKVWLMVLINGIGDLVIISVGGPLWMIAGVTVVNIMFGVVYGAIKNPMLILPHPFVKIRSRRCI